MPVVLKVSRPWIGAAVPLKAVVRTALTAESRTPGDITIVLCDDAAVRELNRRWRGLDHATDVLSFSMEGSPTSARARHTHGDLVISIDRVRAQARRFRVTPGEELVRLVIHGALHLTGRDHHKAAERREMRARETAALRRCRAQIRALDRLWARWNGANVTEGASTG